MGVGDRVRFDWIPPSVESTGRALPFPSPISNQPRITHPHKPKLQDKSKQGGLLDSFSIAHLPSELKLVVCAGGIYASYLTFGVLQEQIFKFRGENGA